MKLQLQLFTATMKLQLQLFTATSEIPDKFFTAAIETFARAMKQAWYYQVN